eukprot:PLAT15548.5.p1 GENE.PLAT15548.5~~PLAT15548.5.p1  ORF type:complete len:403 (-),score=76.72 PLAT15548.5:34-1242(-)
MTEKSVVLPLSPGPLRQYTCKGEGCSDVFTSLRKLKLHYKSAHGINKFFFKCPFEGCGALYGSAYGLKRHHRRHTGERPYLCETCGATFAMQQDRKLHIIRMHMADTEKPFLCVVPGCGTGFPARAELRRHLRFHEESGTLGGMDVETALEQAAAEARRKRVSRAGTRSSKRLRTRTERAAAAAATAAASASAAAPAATGMPFTSASTAAAGSGGRGGGGSGAAGGAVGAAASAVRAAFARPASSFPASSSPAPRMLRLLSRASASSLSSLSSSATAAAAAAAAVAAAAPASATVFSATSPAAALAALRAAAAAATEAVAREDLARDITALTQPVKREGGRAEAAGVRDTAARAVAAASLIPSSLPSLFDLCQPAPPLAAVGQPVPVTSEPPAAAAVAPRAT